MLEVTNLSKAFGAHAVLKNVSFTVSPGTIACILGASGGGKTTLLRCLNGLEQFDSGSVRIGNIEITPDLAPEERTRRALELRKKAGMVFQEFNLFPHMTVLENIVEAPVRVLKEPLAQARKTAHALLEQFKIESKADKYPSRLSGGEKQRVAISRALAMRPQLILFDEPTSALDPERVVEMVALLKELAGRDIAMIIVSHSIGFVGAIADVVFFLADGEIVETGPPSEVLRNPRNERTKRFLRQEALLE